MKLLRSLLVCWPLSCLLVACNHDPRLALDYKLSETLDPKAVSRVETRVEVDPTDPRRFTSDIPFRAIDVGVGYEVRDFDGTGTRTLLITHDATLGYSFDASFTFTLLPPVGDPPPLLVSARAIGASANDVLAQTDSLHAKFSGDTTLSLPLTDLRCGALTCTGNTSCCGGSCTNTGNDPKHCGTCDKDCGTGGDSCSGGTCRCNGGSACTAGSACCPGIGCVDTQSDAFNCGACGKACALGDTCEKGQCSCGGKMCNAGQVCCGGTCTTGGCACGAIGTCSASTPLCCTDSCADTSDDNANCGACGKVCTGQDKCAGGHCRCNGQSVCSGTDTCCPSGCAHLDDDPRNCGACGRSCGSGETCSGGQCRCGTGSGCAGDNKICCVGNNNQRNCVGSNNDRNNCGGCGITCAATEQCSGGACVCPGTGQHCGPNETCCPNVGCFELSTSSDHCGACDKACGALETCVNGSCQTQTTGCIPTCGHHTTCIDKSCFCNGLKTRCEGPGQDCCTGTMGCTDTMNDPKNCGGCGKICPADQPLCCDGGCVPNGEKHCGNCETTCAAPNTCCQDFSSVPARWTCIMTATGGAQALCPVF